MKLPALDIAAHLREAADFIERQHIELLRMTQDRDSLRIVVEALQEQVSLAKLNNP